MSKTYILVAAKQSGKNWERQEPQELLPSLILLANTPGKTSRKNVPRKVTRKKQIQKPPRKNVQKKYPRKSPLEKPLTKNLQQK